MSRQQILLLLSLISSTAIYTFNLWFSISGVFMVLITIFMISILVYQQKFRFTLIKLETKSALLVLLMIFATLSITANFVDINGVLSKAMLLNRLSLFSVLILLFFYFIKDFNHPFLKRILRYKFVLIILLSLLIQLTIIRVVKIPQIDVYDVLRNGPIRLLSFENPYETAETVSGLDRVDYKYDYYAYGPSTLLLFLPFDFVLKDPRYLLILANFVTVYAIYKISYKFWGDEEIAQIFSLLYLFNPRLLHFFTYSMTDLLIVGLISVGLLFYSFRRSEFLAIALAFAVGVKIFYALPFLFFLKLKPLASKRFILTGFITGILIHLPFILLNWDAMYKSMVSLNTNGQYWAQLQRYSLTFATFIDRQFMYYPPQNAFPVIIFSLVVFYWLFIKSSNNMAQVLSIVSLVFIVLIFFGPIANANYYFTISSLILFALAYSGNNKVKYA